jgi:hypothetical protein
MPGPIGITVNGQNIVRPGVYPVVDSSAMVTSGVGAGNNVGVIGQCDGGVPGQVYTFNSYTQAQATLRGGPALSYLARIFSPTSDTSLGAPSVVLFQRLSPLANPPKQAALNVAGLTFTSLDYGRHTNGIAVSIVAGATFGTWSVTISKSADSYSRTYTVGLALSVSSTVPTPQVAFDHINKECSLYSANVIVAQLAYPDTTTTVANLVAWINAQPGWTATLTGDGSMPVCYMDNPALGTAGSSTADAQEDGTVIGTTPTPLYACQGQLIYKLQNDTQVSAALSAGTTFGPLVVLSSTPLTGGAGTGNDPCASSDYTPALALFETQSIQHLFLCTSDPDVHALGYIHVLAMNQVKRRRWRILYAGGPLGQTPAQANAQAKALGGPVFYAWNGTAFPNPITGLAENLGGIGTAAQACGLAAGNPDRMSLTNKMVTASALENPSPEDTDIDALLVGGVSPIVYDPITGSPTIIQAITTYQGGSDVAFRKLQGLRIQFNIQRGWMAVLSPFVGGDVDLITANRIKAKAKKFLDDSTNSAKNPDGVLTQGYSNGKVTPAWDSLSVTTDGTETWTISAIAHPVGEAAYIVPTVYLTPAQIEV